MVDSRGIQRANSRTQRCVAQVHVPLGGRDVLMSCKLLNRFDSLVAQREMRTERVPQDVNADVSKSRSARCASDTIRHHLGCQRLPTPIGDITVATCVGISLACPNIRPRLSALWFLLRLLALPAQARVSSGLQQRVLHPERRETFTTVSVTAYWSFCYWKACHAHLIFSEISAGDDDVPRRRIGVRRAKLSIWGDEWAPSACPRLGTQCALRRVFLSLGRRECWYGA